jgi:ParB-like chromosome segregation protein Spo0J
MQKIEIIKSKLIPVNSIEQNKGQIDGLPKNPRLIKDAKFEKLKKSIEGNPEMLGARELIVYPYNDKFVIIGGNMRYTACKELGYKELPCKVLPSDYSAEQLRAITIKDNVAFGENDWENLANEWDAEELQEWGMELPEISTEIELVDDEANFGDEGISAKNQYGVIVICDSAGVQESVFNDLTNMGFNCKIVVT